MLRTIRPLAALVVAIAVSACSNTPETGDAAPGTPPAAAPGSDAGAPAMPPTAAPGLGLPTDPNSMQALQMELRGIQQKLGPLQQQALQDPALQKSMEDFDALILSKMVAADPETPERQDRLAELQGELMAAQAANDSTKVQEILVEGNTVNQLFQAARATAMADEEVVSTMKELEDTVLGRMKELDPEAGELIERADSIVAILNGGTPAAPVE